ncbi:putative ribonuclease H-like domain-containing protein [Tanacetum coccineum]
MAMSSSSSSSDNEVYDDSYCSKSCRKNIENLNTKINKLNEELSDCETDLYNYKRGLSQVEARLVEFKVNETKFCERIRVLERDVEIRDNKIESLKNELEELKKEKESIDHKLAGFGNALKDLNDLLKSQKSAKDKTGVYLNLWMTLFTDILGPPSVDVSKDVRSDLDGNNTSIFEQEENIWATIDDKGKMGQWLLETHDLATLSFFLSMIPMMEDMCHLDMEVERLLFPIYSTHYELFNGRSPAIGFLRPFGCHVMILNTLDHLVKFDAKGDEGYFVGYSLSSKAFREHLLLTFQFHDAHMETSNDSMRNSEAEDDTQKEQDGTTDVSETSGNTNPTASSKDSLADQVEPVLSLIVESEVPTISSPVPTVSTNVLDSESSELPSSPIVETVVAIVSTPVPIGSKSTPPITLSHPRIISRGGSSYLEPLSLGNVMSSENRMEDFFGDTINSASLTEVEADLSNMETDIQVSPTPTLDINIDIQKSKRLILISYSIVLFSCFLSQEEPKKIIDALKDESWVEAMQEELLQNKTILVAQGHTQEEGIDYKEVFAPVARIEAIRLFLAYASYMRFIVYQMYVKSAFLYGTIDEEVYVKQPPGFEDLEFPNRVYRVEKAMYGLHQAPRAWYGTLSKYLLDNGFQRGTIDQTLFIRKHKGEFLLVQVHQVTPKECHLHAVKRIFRYLKGQPLLGLWYPKESPFNLVAYSDSDYDGDNQDRKSTTGGCQFLGRRLISWQCKKQTIVATSITEAEYVAAASGCGQVLWIQNQLLDYGYNFMNTKIYIDNNSAICIVKNPVYHSRTKHIDIRHHFIRDCYEKKLINVDHIHTDNNVADLLTKPFDVGRFQYLVVSFYGVSKVESHHVVSQTEPHHTPSPQASFPQSQEPIPHKTTTLTSSQEPTSQQISTPSHTLTPRRLTKRAIRIAQSKALTLGADEPASPPRDYNHGEAFPTTTSLDAGQDGENIPKTSAMPHESSPRVTSLGGDEGSLQLELNKLIDFYTKLQSQHS